MNLIKFKDMHKSFNDEVILRGQSGYISITTINVGLCIKPESVKDARKLCNWLEEWIDKHE